MNGFSLKTLGLALLAITLIAMGLGLTNTAFSQTQRNPVLEFCTGTW